MKDRQIAEYISQLKYWDLGVAESASEALGKIGTAAIPALVEALQSDHIFIRRKVPDALGRIGGKAVVPALLEALSHDDVEVRVRAAKALGDVGDVSTVPALLEACRNQDRLTRPFLEGAIGKIGDFDKLARTLLAAPGFSAQKRAAFLEDLRAPYLFLQTIHSPFGRGEGFRPPAEIRSLCATVLEEEDLDARAGAQAVLNWLDRDQYLVRAAESDPQTLLRPLESGNGTAAPDTLLRPVGEEGDGVHDKRLV